MCCAVSAGVCAAVVGSPNFVFGVWDGTTFTSPNNNTWRSVNGSLATTRLYEQYFNRSGLTYSYRPLDNRSDYKSAQHCHRPLTQRSHCHLTVQPP